MNLFRSVFAADPHPDAPEEEGDDDDEQAPFDLQSDGEEGDLSPSASQPAWGFGGLIHNLASRSDSVLQSYRRDLQEFGSGLRRETAALSEVAARAVRDLPASLEAGASAAQDSLESVGRVVDDIGGSVWRGTAEIISHGREALLSMEPPEDYSDDDPPLSSRRYTRFDALLLALQSDRSTFLDDPDDTADFAAWREDFRVAEREIGELLGGDNPALEGMLGKLVPDAVDYETFWIRYFYKVHRLRQAEDARAELVKRVVISAEEEEELSWEVEDDDYESEDVAGKVVKKQEVDGITSVGEPHSKPEEEEELDATKDGKFSSDLVRSKAKVEAVEDNANAAAPDVDNGDDKEEESALNAAKEVGSGNSGEVPAEEAAIKRRELDVKTVENVEASGEDAAEKSAGKLSVEEKAELSEHVDSCKDSDFSVVSSQPSMAEVDDLGWDEIEDLGEHDEKRASTSGGSPSKIDLRKRLAITEDDEDLSWDIEDD